MRWLAACLLMLAATPAHAQAGAGGLQVSPVMLNMPAQRPITHFTLHNGRAREASFEVCAFAWSQENGESVLTPTDDVIVAPSVFLVAAQGDQIVRTALSPAARGRAGEQAYRLLVRQLPDRDATNGVQVLIEMSMPVFVTPNGARGTLTVERTQDANGRPAVVLSNTGAAHIALSAAHDAAVDDLPRYLLAGSRAVRPIHGSAQTMRLNFATVGDVTPQERHFELGDAVRFASQR